MNYDWFKLCKDCKLLDLIYKYFGKIFLDVNVDLNKFCICCGYDIGLFMINCDECCD